MMAWQIVVFIVAPLCIGLGVAIGRSQAKKAVRWAMLHEGLKHMTFDEAGLLLGRIEGRPHEWCSRELAEMAYDSAAPVPLSDEDVVRYAKIATSGATRPPEDLQ